MTVEIYNRQRSLRISTRNLRKVVEAVLAAAGCDDAAVHVTLLGDRAMRKLNHETFEKDRTTNVISFPLGDMPGEAPGLLGDIIVSVDTARREAEAAAMPVADRITQLIIHGLMHILGYEHVGVDEARRRQMRRAEERVFKAVAASASTILADEAKPSAEGAAPVRAPKPIKKRSASARQASPRRASAIQKGGR
jgi:probable rRNA maturation factor